MRIVVRTFVSLLLLGGGAALALLYSGLYNVAATEPHWPLTRWAMETARLHSVRQHAADIRMPVPSPIEDNAKITVGAEHFAAHCAVCHGAPGVPKGHLGAGLYPPAPNLAGAAGRYTPAELFWILKNGIKMSGMPAWNEHGDGELWAIVAFLEKLPVMAAGDYAKLVGDGVAHGHHDHADHDHADHDHAGHDHSDDEPGDHGHMDHGQAAPDRGHGA